jgi:hypothetical protein
VFAESRGVEWVEVDVELLRDPAGGPLRLF